MGRKLFILSKESVVSSVESSYTMEFKVHPSCMFSVPMHLHVGACLTVIIFNLFNLPKAELVRS